MSKKPKSLAELSEEEYLRLLFMAKAGTAIQYYAFEKWNDYINLTPDKNRALYYIGQRTSLTCWRVKP